MQVLWCCKLQLWYAIAREGAKADIGVEHASLPHRTALRRSQWSRSMMAYHSTTRPLSSRLRPITQLIWKDLAEEITDWKLSTNEHSAKVLLLWNNPFVIEALNRSKGAIHVMKRKLRLRQHGSFAMYVRILGLRQGTEGQCWTLSREYSAYSKESAGPFRTREYSAHGKNSPGPSLRQRGGFAMYA